MQKTPDSAHLSARKISQVPQETLLEPIVVPVSGKSVHKRPDSAHLWVRKTGFAEVRWGDKEVRQEQGGRWKVSVKGEDN